MNFSWYLVNSPSLWFTNSILSTYKRQLQAGLVHRLHDSNAATRVCPVLSTSNDKRGTLLNRNRLRFRGRPKITKIKDNIVLYLQWKSLPIQDLVTYINYFVAWAPLSHGYFMYWKGYCIEVSKYKTSINISLQLDQRQLSTSCPLLYVTLIANSINHQGYIIYDLVKLDKSIRKLAHCSRYPRFIRTASKSSKDGSMASEKALTDPPTPSYKPSGNMPFLATAMLAVFLSLFSICITVCMAAFCWCEKYRQQTKRTHITLPPIQSQVTATLPSISQQGLEKYTTISNLQKTNANPTGTAIPLQENPHYITHSKPSTWSKVEVDHDPCDWTLD
ncbi:hypothetical protein TrispH2_008066 [Trichoplax sp. H2]|nr:hypothetical protein TrispH2_008066 [Trichoplax sp. H2]|eukprot:RDD40817.1 hypothetical protein TrispH2_008066 [Trichoplax sp. H2]